MPSDIFYCVNELIYDCHLWKFHRRFIPTCSDKCLRVFTCSMIKQKILLF